MNDELVATVKDEHDGFQQPSLCVKAEAQLPGWAVVVQILNP